jgi:hypothetical protein
MKNLTSKKNLAYTIIWAAACAMTGSAIAANFDVDEYFESATFTGSATIDNAYWPLTFGVTHVYAAETEDGCEINSVTPIGTRGGFEEPYDGITALAVEDLEWLSEECDGDYILMEKTTDWYAQDDDDNIWYLGEETEAYEDDLDCLSDEGAWEAGQDDAKAGIVLLGTPVKGLAYSQEYLEGEAEDMGKVLNLDVVVELESFGPFTDCLKTKEWTPLERGSVEHKYYCPTGGGLMLIKELQGRTVRVEYIGNVLPGPAENFPEDFPADVPDCAED